MPLHKIEETYTLSEISLMAWRSQEQAYQMRSKTKVVPPQRDRAIDSGETNKKILLLDKLSDQMKAPLTDENGEFTLKHQSGEDAARFLSAMGFPVSSIM